MRREDAAAAGFRMIHPTEAKIRVLVGMGVLAIGTITTLVHGCDPMATVPQLSASAGIAIFATGALSQ